MFGFSYNSNRLLFPLLLPLLFSLSDNLLRFLLRFLSSLFDVPFCLLFCLFLFATPAMATDRYFSDCNGAGHTTGCWAHATPTNDLCDTDAPVAGHIVNPFCPDPDNDGCGCRAVADWDGVDSAGYQTAGEAQLGHEQMVEKYMNGGA